MASSKGAVYYTAVQNPTSLWDCHTEMNADVFLRWLENKIFRIKELGKKSILVLDWVVCHTLLTPDTQPMTISHN